MRVLLPVFLLMSLMGAASGQVVARFEAGGAGAGEFALRLAREALDTYCLTRERVAVPAELPALLRQRGGVFVSTMDKNGAPRCCMGTLQGQGANLAADVVAAACLAAAHDRRFPPLKPQELPGLRVIVSFLDPPQATLNPWLLDPVTEGLAVRSARRTGVVLPGETGLISRFVNWALIRADAQPAEKVDYLRLRAIRYIEPAR